MDRREPSPEDLTATLEPVREQLLAQTRDRVLSQWYRQRLTQLETEGRLLRFPLYTN